MKIRFIVEYDTEYSYLSSPWKIHGDYDKELEIVHSGSNYLRIKNGDHIIGQIDCPTEEYAPEYNILRVMMKKHIEQKNVHKNE